LIVCISFLTDVLEGLPWAVFSQLVHITLRSTEI
jgi:hypothetical protein